MFFFNRFIYTGKLPVSKDELENGYTGNYSKKIALRNKSVKLFIKWIFLQILKMAASNGVMKTEYLKFIKRKNVF